MGTVCGVRDTCHLAAKYMVRVLFWSLARDVLWGSEKLGWGNISIGQILNSKEKRIEMKWVMA